MKLLNFPKNPKKVKNIRKMLDKKSSLWYHNRAHPKTEGPTDLPDKQKTLKKLEKSLKKVLTNGGRGGIL